MCYNTRGEWLLTYNAHFPGTLFPFILQYVILNCRKNLCKTERPSCVLCFWSFTLCVVVTTVWEIIILKKKKTITIVRQMSSCTFKGSCCIRQYACYIIYCLTRTVIVPRSINHVKSKQDNGAVSGVIEWKISFNTSEHIAIDFRFSRNYSR